MNVRQIAEVAAVVLITCGLVVGIALAVAALATPRFSVGGPFGPPIEVETWYQFMGRPRPEEPAVIIRMMLVDDPSRPGKALLNVRNYLRYGIDVHIYICIYGADMKIIASGERRLSVESKAKVDDEVVLSWVEGASLRDAKWGELRAEVAGQPSFFCSCSLTRTMSLAISSTAAVRVSTYDGIARIA